MSQINAERLQDRLGNQFVAYYSYCSLPGRCNPQSELLLVTPTASLREVYDALRELEIRAAVLDSELLPFWLQCDPVLGQQLLQGEHWGQTLLHTAPLPLPEQQQARWACHLLFASSELFSDQRSAALDHMLATQPAELSHAARVDALIDLFAHWSEQLTTPAAATPAIADAPSVLPQLRAVYEEIDTGLLVIPDDAALIEETDWGAVAEYYKPQFSRLMVTTVSGLQLLAQIDMPVAFAIGRYRHHWGSDLTPASYDVSQLLQHAARTVLSLLIEELPLTYVDNPNMGRLVHDIQNRLLKVQFQYELLGMLFEIERKPAPRLHIDRSLPYEQRVEVLIDFMRAWVDLYVQLLAAAAPPAI